MSSLYRRLRSIVVVVVCYVIVISTRAPQARSLKK